MEELRVENFLKFRKINDFKGFIMSSCILSFDFNQWLRAFHVNTYPSVYMLYNACFPSIELTQYMEASLLLFKFTSTNFYDFLKRENTLLSMGYYRSVGYL